MLFSLVRVLPYAFIFLVSLHTKSIVETTQVVAYNGFRSFDTRLLHLKFPFGLGIATENSNDALKLAYPVDVWFSTCSPDGDAISPADSLSTIPDLLKMMPRE